MNLLRYAPIIIQWAPIIYSTVLMVEQVVGPGRTGRQKKEIVLAHLSKLAKQFDLAWGPEAINILSELIDTTVGIMNLLGYFRHAEDSTDDDLAVAAFEADETEEVLQYNLSKVIEEDEDLQDFIGHRNLQE